MHTTACRLDREACTLSNTFAYHVRCYKFVNGTV
jgi:hypothetical protein